MATVRASCPTCGDVEMTTRDVQVQVGEQPPASSYSFLCPACRILVHKPATERVLQILVGAGVRVVTWSRPAELDEVRVGPPISHDDLLGFHCSLDQPGWLEAEVARLASPGPHSRTP